MISLLFVLLAPLIALVFVPIKRTNRNLFYGVSVIISLVSIYLSFYIDISLKFEIPSIAFSILMDKYSKIFLILVSSTWLISIIYSYEYTKYNFHKKRIKFFIFLNIILSIAMINACAGNLITLFVFYLIGIPLTYPLINFRNNDVSRQSAKGFLKQTILPSLFIFLPAIVITEYLIGHVSFGDNTTLGNHHINPIIGGILLLMFIIGISKNSVFPFSLMVAKYKPGAGTG